MVIGGRRTQNDGDRLPALVLLGLAVALSVFGRVGRGEESKSESQEPLVKRGEKSPSVAGFPRRAAAPDKPLRDSVLESDNLTFRPTVLIRRGTSQGSGTIIASLDGDTLVLTASHVIRGSGPIQVELHRYNLGIERVSSSSGKWPRQVAAEAVATDLAADMAILRVRNMVALPFVARLGSGDDGPATNADVTSVGIDLGSKLSSWKTRLVEVLWFELNDSGNHRPFLVTAKIPEHGRSGGGLFDKNGRLVGACVGHAELVKGRRMGVFSSIESARQLLRDHELTSVIDRSEARRARLARSFPSPGRHLTRPPSSTITSTEAREQPPIQRP
jgi:S1-C subfamily serine protease